MVENIYIFLASHKFVFLIGFLFQKPLSYHAWKESERYKKAKRKETAENRSVLHTVFNIKVIRYKIFAININDFIRRILLMHMETLNLCGRAY